MTGRSGCAPRYALVVSALLAILMFTGAIQPRIVVRSASTRVPADAPHAEASASCQPGEALIGGGFAAKDTFEYAARIVASYPASDTTWTVAAAASPAFTLRAEAYCVPASMGFGQAIIHAPMNPTGVAVCPAGSVLLSGGIQAGGPASASRPDGNGWYAATPGPSAGTVYALCASQRVREGSEVTASLDPHSSSRGQQPDGATLSCAAGQTATAGGFNGGGLALTSATAGVPHEGWSVVAGGDGDLTPYAHCVTLAD